MYHRHASVKEYQPGTETDNPYKLKTIISIDMIRFFGILTVPGEFLAAMNQRIFLQTTQPSIC